MRTIFVVIIICAVVISIFSVNGLGETNYIAQGEMLQEKLNLLIGRFVYAKNANRSYSMKEGDMVIPGDVKTDPDFWQGIKLEGIVYDPHGDNLKIRPAEGYTFFVDSLGGATRILSYNLGWSLIYSLEDKDWYFHRIGPDSIIDISTLRIKKDTPYNPEEYR